MQGKAGTSGFLVWSCACRSVCNEFTIEIYDFTRSLRAFLAHATRGAINITMKDSEDRKQQEANKWVQRYRGQLTDQQRDEKRWAEDSTALQLGNSRHYLDSALPFCLINNFPHAHCEAC